MRAVTREERRRVFGWRLLREQSDDALREANRDAFLARLDRFKAGKGWSLCLRRLKLPQREARKLDRPAGRVPFRIAGLVMSDKLGRRKVVLWSTVVFVLASGGNYSGYRGGANCASNDRARDEAGSCPDCGRSEDVAMHHVVGMGRAFRVNERASLANS